MSENAVASIFWAVSALPVFVVSLAVCLCCVLGIAPVFGVFLVAKASMRRAMAEMQVDSRKNGDQRS